MLKFEFWSIFEAVANVIILFVLLRIFLFKPINKIMDERTQSVQKNIDDAEKAKKEADELRQQYEDSISEAKEEASRIIMKAHDDAETERANIIQKSHEEADQIVNAASETIENERRRVLQQAQSQIADLAIEAASKIVGANLDDDKNRQLVDKFLSGEEGDK
ncbi:MAG: F0F1 ATP synthase subunit B [Ruminococcus sp.]|nr:F0F1 ATP synthase subunit B [Ruminococcus sp.]